MFTPAMHKWQLGAAVSMARRHDGENYHTYHGLWCQTKTTLFDELCSLSTQKFFFVTMLPHKHMWFGRDLTKQ